MSSNTNINNPKCSNCKCYFTPTLKSSGQPFKTCHKCRIQDKKSRQNNKCEHDKRKSRCIQCGGNGICEHDKLKSRCIQCGGIELCEHDKRKSKCRECGGSEICEHDKRRARCILCGGSEICEHEKRKAQCKDCNLKLCLIRLHTKRIKTYLTSPRYEIIKNHYNDDLGCTVQEFIDHIKTKMNYFNTFLATSEQMTFENITIDHIKPISKFNLDNVEEYMDCCHYSNIQPLSKSSNFVKAGKWTNENNIYWLENIRGRKYKEIYIS